MCGILGRVGLVDYELDAGVEKALRQLGHRGPDDRGTLRLNMGPNTVDLGQTRLSIIDLSTGGHQPMQSSDGRYSLVFNGEIYNYREVRSDLKRLGRQFVSDSDTEVLLQAWAEWGIGCLRRMTGMWAFAVFDALHSTLTCVRDAFGIKPLFYATQHESFAFASELPALRSLLRGPSEVNLQRLYEYLVFGSYDTGADTFLAEVQQVLPGHVLTVSFGGGHPQLLTERWWCPAIEEEAISFEDASERLRDLFLESVRLHLRSDVSLGAALSGGIDSSSVVAAIRYLEPDSQIHAFSYVARGHDVDEESWVDLAAASSGARVTKVELSADDLARDLDRMIAAQGEPFGSTSIYAQYRVYQLARESGVTVTLDGQGADELLAGYEGYPGPRLSSLVRSGHFVTAGRFAREWRRWPGRSMATAARGVGVDLAPRWARQAGYRLSGRAPNPAWLNEEVCRDFGVAIRPPARLDEAPVPGRRLAQQLRRELTAGGLQALLRHGDRNSMRWSVESRVPFLTTQLAEFCLSLPEDYLVSAGGETKHVFRHAMRGIVPNEILDRRDKIGFQTPEQDWLASLRPSLGDWLEGLDAFPIVNPSAARTAVFATVNGDRPFSWLAWRLINAARWVQLIS
jgi:asparagine synthase (glutamine-hydrolysing)